MSTTELAFPPSRVAGVVNGVIDASHRLTKPLFLDVDNVPAEGPFMLVGNHQLLGMQDLPSLVRGLEVERGVRVRGLADRFHFTVPVWRSILASVAFRRANDVAAGRAEEVATRARAVGRGRTTSASTCSAAAMISCPALPTRASGSASIPRRARKRRASSSARC
jgi:hypothetical protein